MRGFAAFLLISSVAAADDSLVSIGDSKYLTSDFAGGKITLVRYPTLGCPAIVKAGATGTVWVKSNATDYTLVLVPTLNAAGASYALPVIGTSYDGTITKVSYSVPANVPADTYDLTVGIASLSLSDTQPNSFRVVTEEPSDFRFLVVTDTHFNCPTGFWKPGNYNATNYDAWTIMLQLKKEFRALNPTFVILTGDIVFGLDYDYEFDGAWDFWKDTGVPIFMVPGNHDAYACIKDRWFLGLHSPIRDGLDYYRKTFGPCFYSFQFGGVHFQGVNSADGTPERRDGFLIVIQNYGGDLLPEQMDWVAADLAGVTGPVIPFMHHDPSGPYKPNKTFGMLSWVLYKLYMWITTGELTVTDGQTWNTQETGEFLVQKYASIPFVFGGHKHKDIMHTVGATTYRLLTAASTSCNPYWGFASVRVQNGSVTDHLYSDDPEKMSIPIGNLHIEPLTEYSAKVTSGLAKPYDVTVEFLVPTAPAFEATNGVVLQTAVVGDKTKVWVKVTAPVAADVETPETVEVSIAPAAVVAGSVETAPAGGGGGGGGGSCGLLGIEILSLFALRALGRRRSTR